MGAPSSCGGATSGPMAISEGGGGHGSSLPLSGFSIPASIICAVPLLNRPFVVGPGNSPILEKLVTNTTTRQFVDLAD